MMLFLNDNDLMSISSDTSPSYMPSYFTQLDLSLFLLCMWKANKEVIIKHILFRRCPNNEIHSKAAVSNISDGDLIQ